MIERDSETRRGSDCIVDESRYDAAMRLREAGERLPVMTRLDQDQYDWLRWFGYTHGLSLDASIRLLVKDRSKIEPVPCVTHGAKVRCDACAVDTARLPAEGGPSA